MLRHPMFRSNADCFPSSHCFAKTILCLYSSGRADLRQRLVCRMQVALWLFDAICGGYLGSLQRETQTSAPTGWKAGRCFFGMITQTSVLHLLYFIFFWKGLEELTSGFHAGSKIWNQGEAVEEWTPCFLCLGGGCTESAPGGGRRAVRDALRFQICKSGKSNGGWV